MMMLLKVLPMCQMLETVVRRKRKGVRTLTANLDPREIKSAYAKVAPLALNFHQQNVGLEIAVSLNMIFESISKTGKGRI